MKLESIILRVLLRVLTPENSMELKEELYKETVLMKLALMM